MPCVVAALGFLFLGALCVLILESGICTFVQHFCSIRGEFIA